MGRGGHGASQVDREEVADLVADTPKLSWIRFAFITFVFTSAGPFGMEGAVKSGGPFVALCVVFLVPIIHVLPMILVVTEMNGMMPSNHGSVRWVDKAYGPVVGFVSATLQLIINVVDISIYPVLAKNYLKPYFFPHISMTGSFFVQLIAIVVGSIPAFLQVSHIGSISAVAMGLISVPFVIGTAQGLDAVTPAQWAPINHTVDWPQVMTVGIWMYTGFMALGSLGGETENAFTILRGSTFAVLLDVMMYFFPLIVALAVAPDSREWSDGFLVTAFDRIQPGMGFWVSLAGAMSGIALYTSSLCCFARTLWGVADKRWAPRVFAQLDTKTNCPTNAVIAHMVAASVLGLFDFEFLVALELVVSAVNFGLLFCTAAVLRKKAPDVPRPFAIPGGLFGTVALVTPILIVFAILFVINVWNDWRQGLAVVMSIAVLAGLYTFVVDDASVKSGGRVALRSADSVTSTDETLEVVTKTENPAVK